jgi:hypothetical protein
VSGLCPWLRHVFADGGYAGDKLKGALEGLGKWTEVDPARQEGLAHMV